MKSSTTLPELLDELEAAWNSADGDRWGAVFSETAQFVDIRGDHHHGRSAIAAGHQAIFDTIYKNSVVRYDLQHQQPVTACCDIAIIHATLDAPSGPLAGRHHSTITAAITSDDDVHIVAFHNTLIQPNR